MNTSKSNKKVKEWLESGQKFIRKELNQDYELSGTPEQIFPLLCPSRELDWIDGWDCDIVYSSTGYAEDKCIFTTDGANSTGSGLWIFTGYEPGRKVEIIRIIENTLVMNLSISLTDNGDGTTKGTWSIVITAISNEGNAIINKMPDIMSLQSKLIEGLNHYLKTGEIQKAKFNISKHFHRKSHS